MRRALWIAAALVLFGCGVDGPPIAPEGSVQEIMADGVELTPEKGSI